MEHMTEESVTENFEVDPAIIYPVIQSQAGTLAKALLECCTNSFDANAKRIDIEINQTSARVIDDGHGIQTVEEIQKFFRRFGTPHQEGDSKVGRFRIGRGQAFVFGVTTWKTGPFKMVVDLRNKGLDYDRKTYAQSHDGCEIDIALYEPLSMMDYTSITREIGEMVYHMPIPVYLNGTQVNVLPQDQKWDVETEQYWLAVNKNGAMVEFFNQGHYVCREHLGIGGKVVTKPGVALDVNMARNQIQHDDPTYKQAKEYFRKLVREESINKISRMDDGLRAKLFGQILSGEIVFPIQVLYRPQWHGLRVPESFEDAGQWREFCEALSKRALMVSASGKGFSMSRFENSKTWTIAPEPNTMIADKLEQRGVTVVHPKVLEWLGLRTDAKALKDGVETHAGHQDIAERLTNALYSDHHAQHRMNRRFVPFTSLAENYSERHEVIQKKDLKRTEVAQLYILKCISNGIAWTLRRMARQGLVSEEFSSGVNTREVVAGKSDSARAWTDGASTIYVDRTELKGLNQGFAGTHALVMLMLHEYCHKEDTSTGHQHDHAFYQTFHDICTDPEIGAIVAGAVRSYAKTLEQRNLKIPRSVAESIDAGDSLFGVMDDKSEDSEQDVA